MTTSLEALLGPLDIPPGYGFRKAATPLTTTDLPFNHLLIWEAPRKEQRYVISVDTSSGIGQDRSVIEVTRVGTLSAPDEQVAQFISDDLDPVALAPFVEAVGRFYPWTAEGLPALVAIECNNHGIATQTEILQHYNYDHLFVWRHEDAINPKSRLSRGYGWYTTHKSRPIIIARYVKAITTVDEHTGMPDYRIHSPFTLEELRSFETPGPLWMASAGPGGHDDCIMAGAIGTHVAYTLYMDEVEPVHERRRRHAEEEARKAEEARLSGAGVRSAQNTAITCDELDEAQGRFEPGEDLMTGQDLGGSDDVW